MTPLTHFTVTTDERKSFGACIKSVSILDGFASNLSKNMNLEHGKISELKSHDSHVIIQRLLAPEVRKFLSKDVGDTIAELSSFFSTNVHANAYASLLVPNYSS